MLSTSGVLLRANTGESTAEKKNIQLTWTFCPHSVFALCKIYQGQSRMENLQRKTNVDKTRHTLQKQCLYLSCNPSPNF